MWSSPSAPPPLATRMFAGLTSRWMRPFACAAVSALATGDTIDDAPARSIGPSRWSCVFRSHPSTKRIAMKKVSSRSPAS